MKKHLKGNKFIKNVPKFKKIMGNKELFNTLSVITIILIFYIGFFQELDIYKSRSETTYNIVNSVEKNDILDENTPVGIKQEYKWKLDNIDRDEKYVAFYMVHQYTNVYINGQLEYSLKLNNSNKIGKTPGCNWVIIPVHPEDNGAEMCVEIIPVYKDAVNTEPKFIVGSKFDIYLNQFKSDLLDIILGLIAFIVGIILFFISSIKRHKEEGNSYLTYLFVFLCLIGIWKLTDLRLATLIFITGAQVLSYTSMIMIYIAYGALLLSIKSQFVDKYSSFVKRIINGYCIGILSIVLLQILNIADLRESLYFVHIMICIISVASVVVFICEIKSDAYNKKLKRTSVCSMICMFGFILDILAYYISGNEANISHTIVASIICIFIMAYIYLRDINERANIDTHTGLFNKSKCNEFLDENYRIEGSLGIIMFDLNGLKRVNDTLGHKYGDIIIADFAKIIRENISEMDFAGRYGGDEFIVVVKDANNEAIKNIDSKISCDVIEYNRRNLKLNLSYSMGYCLSIDYPGLSLRDLLEKADARMYEMKREYHSRNK